LRKRTDFTKNKADSDRDALKGGGKNRGHEGDGAPNLRENVLASRGGGDVPLSWGWGIRVVDKIVSEPARSDSEADSERGARQAERGVKSAEKRGLRGAR